MSEPPTSADWSFVDAAYLITCPQSSGAAQRLTDTREVLGDAGVLDRVTTMEFATDDEDRIRGCYTSHISVLQDARSRFPGRDDVNILVFEDNVNKSPWATTSDTLKSVSKFLQLKQGYSVLHLAYIMYVPGLSTERLPGEDRIVRLQCSADSVLGTTSYLISGGAMDAVLGEHERVGYVDAIPNVMARLFGESRLAAYPMPFHRSYRIKSLVNGQLDSLRSLLFRPLPVQLFERVLVSSGLDSTTLFILICALISGSCVVSVLNTIYAVQALLDGQQVDLLVPILSAILGLASGGVLIQGMALAPTPAPAPKDDTSTA